MASKRQQRHDAVPAHVSALAPLVLLATLVGIWWLATSLTAVQPWMLPSPGDFIVRFWSEIHRPTLWASLWITLHEAVLGCLVGAAVALPLSYAIYRFKYFSAAVEPFLGATQAIPAIALAPLLVLWVGYGLGAIVALCTLIVFFPILVSSTVGLRHLDRDVLDAARLDGASGLSLLIFVEGPLALPSILAGLRNGFTLSVTGAVVGEMVMGGQGLGTLLTIQRNSVDTTGMFVTIALLCLLAMTAYSLIYLFERQSKLVNYSH
ncbi:MAG: ABC transporter permease [Actinomycetaceae bacterium]|nr:ABC transporter permease [Actinomycetaceae bacterium]